MEEKKAIKKVYNILVIGCGGTGTYFLKELTRFLATVDKKLPIVGLTVADGDLVEEKNLKRQNFTMDDIGMSKSTVFCDALNDLAMDVCSEGTKPIFWNSVTNYITSMEQLEKVLTLDNGTCRNKQVIPVIIGCVDNHGCRKLCEEYFHTHEWCYLFDSGNEFSSGECCMAYKEDGEVLSPVKSYYFPDILTGDTRQVTELSCEELNVSAPQHFVTNLYAAMQLLVAVVKLLQNDEKVLGWSIFDSFSLTNQFYPYQK